MELFEQKNKDDKITMVDGDGLVQPLRKIIQKKGKRNSYLYEYLIDGVKLKSRYKPFNTFDFETYNNIEKFSSSKYGTANRIKKYVESDDFDELDLFVNSTAYVNEKYKSGIGKDNAEATLLNMPKGIYYGWNVSGFDNHFTISILSKNGYVAVPDIPSDSAKRRLMELPTNCYSTFMNSKNQILELKVKRGSIYIVFKDFYKIASSSLDGFFKDLGEKAKPKYDYNKLRVNASDFSKDDLDYIRWDVVGLSNALLKLCINVEQIDPELANTMLSSMTAGSMTMKYFKKSLYKILGLKKHEFRYFNDRVKLVFDNDVSIEDCFGGGGDTFTNPATNGRKFKNVNIIDVVSMYPWAMAYALLPYGQPIIEKQIMTFDELNDHLNDEHYVFAKHVKGIGTVKGMTNFVLYQTEKGHRTSITRDDIHLATEWEQAYETIYSAEVTQCGLTTSHFNTGLISFSDDSEFEVTVFHATKGILEESILHLFAGKEKYSATQLDKPALKLLFKIMLNAGYGKFLQRVTTEEYFHDGTEIFVNEIDEDEQEKSWFMYNPFGYAITATCRCRLASTVDILGNNDVLGGDTDSVFTTLTDEELKEKLDLGIKLGDWEYDSKKDKYDEFVMFAKKTYVMKQNGITSFKMCGVGKKDIMRDTDDEIFDIGKISLDETIDKYFKGIKISTMRSVVTNKGIVFYNLITRKQDKRFFKEGNINDVYRNGKRAS